MGRLHEAGDYVATAGLIGGLVPAFGLFFAAAGAQKRGDLVSMEYFGDTAVWFGGVGLVVMLVGFGMMQLGNRKTS